MEFVSHEFCLLCGGVFPAKGAVTTVKSREQCDSCWVFSTTSSLKGGRFLVTGNMSPSSEQQLVVTRSIPLVTAFSWTTASFRQEDSLEVGKNFCINTHRGETCLLYRPNPSQQLR